MASWYPKPSLPAPNKNLITLVVTDWCEGDIHPFMTSFEAASTYMSSANSAWTCSASRTLMFDRVVVVTANETCAAEYRASYPGVDFVARDWSSGWWDICTNVTSVSTRWFMQVTAYFLFDENFVLPSTSLGDELIPVVGYIDYDSVHCVRECRQEILNARAVDPIYNRYHLQSFSIYHTSTVADYCHFLLELGTSHDTPLYPSPTSYFAFVVANQSIGAFNTTCPDGPVDEPRCASVEAKFACTRNSSVGEDVRAACRAMCGTCDSELIEDAIDWRALNRRHTCITYQVHTGKTNASYEMHDMVCHPPKRTFVDRDLRRRLHAFSEYGESTFTTKARRARRLDGQRCEDQNVTTANFTDCPCQCDFFFTDNSTGVANSTRYKGCVIFGDDPKHRCPTSLTNTLEYKSGSKDVRYCDPAQECLSPPPSASPSTPPPPPPPLSPPSSPPPPSSTPVRIVPSLLINGSDQSKSTYCALSCRRFMCTD